MDARFSGSNNIRPNDHRNPFQRDRARILHSSAFRRLQAKTQIVGIGKDDFYRTRLTHSLEVSQIGTGILAHLHQQTDVLANPELLSALPSDALIESLCLAHDIGHPPFGHGGEIALNYKMWKAGGFEANGHTLRIVSKLEPYTKTHGMDLTRRTLLGLIKYPQFIRTNTDYQGERNQRFFSVDEWKPIKGIFGTEISTFQWILEGLSKDDQVLFKSQTNLNKNKVQTSPYIKTKTTYKSLDASIMEMADDIAYAVHDLEDAIALNIVNKDMWITDVLDTFSSAKNPWAKKHASQLTEMLFNDELHQRKNAIGALVNHLITNTETFQVNQQFNSPILAFNIRLNDAASPILELLKKFVYQRVILSTAIQQTEFKGQQVLTDLFDAFYTEPKRLMGNSVSLSEDTFEDEIKLKRFVCDTLANMSDNQALQVYGRLFGDGKSLT